MRHQFYYTALYKYDDRTTVNNSRKHFWLLGHLTSLERTRVAAARNQALSMTAKPLGFVFFQFIKERISRIYAPTTISVPAHQGWGEGGSYSPTGHWEGSGEIPSVQGCTSGDIPCPLFRSLHPSLLLWIIRSKWYIE